VPGEWELIGRLALTLVLSAAIGLERELRQKSAGLRTLPRPRSARRVLRVAYQDGRGVLRDALAACTRASFVVADITTTRLSDEDVAVHLELQGAGPFEDVVAEIGELDGVLAVSAESDEAE
jgi:putative Mg2+ transporter-C (MgtC) family protein